MTREKPTRQTQMARLSEELRHIGKSMYPAAGGYEETRTVVVIELCRRLMQLSSVVRHERS